MNPPAEMPAAPRGLRAGLDDPEVAVAGHEPVGSGLEVGGEAALALVAIPTGAEVRVDLLQRLELERGKGQPRGPYASPRALAQPQATDRQQVRRRREAENRRLRSRRLPGRRGRSASTGGRYRRGDRSRSAGCRPSPPPGPRCYARRRRSRPCRSPGTGRWRQRTPRSHRGASRCQAPAAAPRRGREAPAGARRGRWTRRRSSSASAPLLGDPRCLGRLLVERLPVADAAAQELWPVGHGDAGTAGSGSSDHRAGWCQQRSFPLASRCARMAARNRFTSSMSCSRDSPSRSSSIIAALRRRPRRDRPVLLDPILTRRRASPAQPSGSSAARPRGDSR